MKCTICKEYFQIGERKYIKEKIENNTIVICEKCYKRKNDNKQ